MKELQSRQRSCRYGPNRSIRRDAHEDSDTGMNADPTGSPGVTTGPLIVHRETFAFLHKRHLESSDKVE
ncbi:unnamed protein product [Lampetra planeri]